MELLEAYAKSTEAAIDRYLPNRGGYQKKIYEAMRYSVLGGGKRLRGVLAQACCKIACGSCDAALPFAAAIEMVHAYSLIHDDLPAMDNDDLRRGKPTNHKVFGEATAILAGDGLLGCAFECVLENAENPQNGWRALKILARALGPEGMLGGQVIDIESENTKIDEEKLKTLHSMKTGALIKAACMGGACMGGADGALLQALGSYAEKIGMAFQIRDDILDVTGDAAVLGKNVGGDEKQCKSTFVTVYGLEKSEDYIKELSDGAAEIAASLGADGEFLAELAQRLAVREK